MKKNGDWRLEGQRLKDVTTMKLARVLCIAAFSMGAVLLAFIYRW
jgi:hypothetical protein